LQGSKRLSPARKYNYDSRPAHGGANSTFGICAKGRHIRKLQPLYSKMPGFLRSRGATNPRLLASTAAREKGNLACDTYKKRGKPKTNKIGFAEYVKTYGENAFCSLVIDDVTGCYDYIWCYGSGDPVFSR